MAITEIKHFKTDDGEMFSTLDAALEHERKRKLLEWLVARVPLKEAVALRDQLLRDFVLMTRGGG